ncbi:hypothetical protein N7536_003486 [Penicillium majusculum]|nr:hypothetical protein N7536_003486 [Penicillium majusculum]
MLFIHRQKHSRARDRTGNLLGPCCERDAMTIRPRDLIINISVFKRLTSLALQSYLEFYYTILIILYYKLDVFITPPNAKEVLKISYQVAWPNGHGVSLTTRSEKVPGSIPGATMFLSLYVAWPNGHGVSLTIRSEKVPGSIPGATIFLVRSSC